MTYIGQSVKRVEDKRFTTGKGKYTDDIKLVGMTHAHIVRSPYAHAIIKSIDIDTFPNFLENLCIFLYFKEKTSTHIPMGDFMR